MCWSHGANSQGLRARPNSNLGVCSSDHSGDASGGDSDLGDISANDVLGVCVPISRERDEAESPGGIQGNAGKRGGVECRLDQIFRQGGRHS
jgi:hypothetical protein